MTGTETLDDLERTIARTLAAKADQIVVDEPGPSLLDGGTEAPSATVIHLTPPRPSRRRVLAVAAAAVLAVAGVAVGGRLLDDGDDATVPAAAVPATVNGTREVGPIGLLPAGPPEGWRLTSLDVGTTIVGQAATQWQLFAPSGAPSPLDRGVLVSSASVDGPRDRGCRPHRAGPARRGGPTGGPDPTRGSGHRQLGGQRDRPRRGGGRAVRGRPRRLPRHPRPPLRSDLRGRSTRSGRADRGRCRHRDGWAVVVGDVLGPRRPGRRGADLGELGRPVRRPHAPPRRPDRCRGHRPRPSPPAGRLERTAAVDRHGPTGGPSTSCRRARPPPAPIPPCCPTWRRPSNR